MPYRVPLARLLRIGLLTAALACARASGAQPRLDVAVGLDGLWRPNSWAPIAVGVTGPVPNAEGVVRVVSRQPGGQTVRYERAVRFSPATTGERYVLPVRLTGRPGASEAVEIAAEGRTLASHTLPRGTQVPWHHCVAVALTADRGGLGSLARARMVPVWRQADWDTGAPPGSALPPDAGTVHVAYPGPADLPEHQAGYDAVDLVVLGDVSADALTDSQWAALAGWIRAGGLMVVSGGADLERVRMLPVADLLPIAPTRVRQVRALTALRERYGTGPTWTGAALLDGPPRAGTRPLCTQGDVAALSLRRVACGAVVLASFDLLAPEFRQWANQHVMWAELARVGAPEWSAVRALAHAVEPSSQRVSGPLVAGLAGPRSAAAPGAGAIAAFVGLYILLLVPVNRLALKRLGRRELAWVTGPLIIGVFTLGAYGFGYALKGGPLQLRSITVLEGGANADDWTALTVVSAYSPRDERYRIESGGRSAVAYVRAASRLWDPTVPPHTVRYGLHTAVQDVRVPMWDHREVVFSGGARLGGAVSAWAEPLSDGRLRVHVANGTGRPLEGGAVTAMGRSARFSTLAPGGDAVAELDPASAAVGSPIGALGLPAETPLGAIARSARDILAQDAGNPGVQPAVVVAAWLSTPVDPSEVTGRPVKQQGPTLLVVHVPVKGLAPAAGPPVDTPREAPPPDTAALARAARQRMQAGDLDGALDTALAAREAAPDDPTLLALLGEVRLERGEHGAAEQAFGVAEANPSFVPSPRFHLNYGRVLEAQGRAEEALARFRRAQNAPGMVGAAARDGVTRLQPGSAGVAP